MIILRILIIIVEFQDLNNMEKINNFVNDIASGKDQAYKNYLIESIQKLVNVENAEKRDLRLIQKSLSEIVDSISLFGPYREIRKVSIFGSARTEPSHPNFKLAEETARKITEANMMVITGAGPGIMLAGNKGAQEDKSFGLHIQLPFEEAANDYIVNTEKLISYKYFFTRKLTFVKESDAFVLFPGGFGTQDEGFEVLTLIQTGTCSPRPFVIINYDKSHYWKSWKNYVQTQLLDRSYISPLDIEIIKVANTPEEAVEYVTSFYKIYHSIKYYNRVACMRINKALNESELSAIQKEFSSLLSSGTFKIGSHKDFEDETDIHPDKPRLIFHFNNNFGGLIQLIEFINKFN